MLAIILQLVAMKMASEDKDNPMEDIYFFTKVQNK